MATRARDTLAKNVRAIRLAKGYSQEELAFACGLHRTYISDIERGTRNISLDNIERIATALDVQLSELFNSNELASDFQPVKEVPRRED